MPAAALAIFTSAFLLFQIQPLIAKYILPWYGGGPAVWGVSMLFFQTALVAGYAYAHVLVRYLDARRQGLVHLVLLAVAASQLPVSPSAPALSSSMTDPTLEILLVLARTIGLPFFALSATAPLIQAWTSRTNTTANPYRLYALSNAASLTALLSYPFVVEPLVTRQTQTLLWSGMFGCFLAVCAWCAWDAGLRTRSTPASRAGAGAPGAGAGAAAGESPGEGIATWLLWLALPATAVALLLGVTNHLTRDLVSIPFLWVLPLSAYLLSYIICFDSERWYRRDLFIPAMVSCVAGLLYLLLTDELIAVRVAVIAFNVGLFVLCMVCHGELNRLRPAPARLTGFYLMIAVGGALGSAVVALAMPVLTNAYLELQFGIGSVVLLTALVLVRDRELPQLLAVPLKVGAVVAVLVAVALLERSTREYEPDVLLQTRNFYGVLTVGTDRAGEPDEARWLRNGSSYHGVQFAAPRLRSLPGAYYTPSSGVGSVMASPSEGGRRIGMIGLGVGSIAAYGRRGDSLRIYEIDPDVVEIASTAFTFLDDSAAEIEVVVGDARRSLEQEAPQAFDIFVVDAFSSDAIPVHLVTREAFEVYTRHLAEEGVIAVLISSWFFDFEPLLHAMAQEFDMQSVLVVTRSGRLENWGSRWVIMTRNSAFMEQAWVQRELQRRPPRTDPVRLWSDDYSSPFQLLK